MDYSKYIASCKSGTIARQRIGNVWVFVVKQFDPATGAELPPNVVTVNPEQVLTDIKKLKETLSNLEALYADLTAIA